MSGAWALRTIAVAIAIAGVADPAITRQAAVRQPVAIVIASANGLVSAQRMRTLLERDYEVNSYAPDMPGAAACPQKGGCILISDGELPSRLTAGATVIGAVRRSPNADGIAITDVTVPAAVHVAASALLRVQLSAPASRVEVFDGNVLVGAADPQARSDAELNVAWVPIAAGARRLTVRAGGAEAHVAVMVNDASASVLFYEPEATWLGTFVRRAVERDSRFKVVGRTRLAPPVSVNRGGTAELTREALRDVQVVLVAAADSLSEAEVDLLERFVRVRGGSVVIVPDRRPSGALMRLLPSLAGEHREAQPIAIGALRATEVVSFSGASPGVSILEAAGDRAVVVSRALGRGRIVVSGALDAWRYRGGDSFNGFWTSLVADAADAAGPPLRLTIDPPVVSSGGEATVTAEWRTLEELRAEITSEASMTCGDVRSIIRLWPTGRPGRFSGKLRPEGLGECELMARLRLTGEAASNPLTVSSSQSLRVDEVAASGPINAGKFEAAIAAHGGVVVTSGDEEALVERVRERMPERREPQESRPMHSPWWILPFAAALGGEWWLRRRAGLR